ncbi:MAG: HEAT repeat domain-containing protein [Acidobacteriota bacterium]
MKRGIAVAGAGIFLVLMLVTGCGGGREVKYRELWSDNEDVRLQTIADLGKQKKLDAVPDLIKLLEDNEEVIRVEAIRSLGKIGDPSAIRAFQRLLNDNLDSIRIAVAMALGDIKTRECTPLLGQLMKDRDETVRNLAGDSLLKIDDPSVIPLFVRIAIYDESEDVRDQTIRFLAARGVKEAIPLIENAVLSETDKARAHAAFVLGRLGDSSSVPTLIKALEDPFPGVRAMAALGLSNVKDSSCVPALKKLAGTEQDELVLVEVSWSLARFGDDASKEVLRKYLIQGQAVETRGEAAKALGDVGDTSSIPLLKKAMKDRSGLVREEARKALEKLEKAA